MTNRLFEINVSKLQNLQNVSESLWIDPCRLRWSSGVIDIVRKSIRLSYRFLPNFSGSTPVDTNHVSMFSFHWQQHPDDQTTWPAKSIWIEPCRAKRVCWTPFLVRKIMFVWSECWQQISQIDDPRALPSMPRIDNSTFSNMSLSTFRGTPCTFQKWPTRPSPSWFRRVAQTGPEMNKHELPEQLLKNSCLFTEPDIYLLNTLFALMGVRKIPEMT